MAVVQRPTINEKGPALIDELGSNSKLLLHKFQGLHTGTLDLGCPQLSYQLNHIQSTHLLMDCLKPLEAKATVDVSFYRPMIVPTHIFFMYASPVCLNY